MFDVDINVFPNLNSGKVRKFQGFGNLCIGICIDDRPISGNPYFPLLITNPLPAKKNVSIESIHANSTGQNAFLVKTGPADQLCAQLQTGPHKLT